MTTELECLLKELANQQSAIAGCDEVMRNTFFYLVTSFGVFAGIYAGEKIIDAPEFRSAVIVVLSQLIYFLLLRINLEFCCQVVHRGYSCSLENRVNTLVGSPVILWESVVATEFLAKPKSAFYASTVVLSLAGLVGFTLAAWFVLQLETMWWYGPLVFVETVAILVLFASALRDVARVEKFCDEVFSRDMNEPQNPPTPV